MAEVEEWEPSVPVRGWKSEAWPFLFLLALALASQALPFAAGTYPKDGFDLSIYDLFKRQLVEAWTAHGELALWNPFWYGGSPNLADTRVALLYPGTWLFLVLPGWLAWNVNHVLVYACAFVGMYGFLRERGFSSTASLCGAVLYGWGGALTLLVFWCHFDFAASCALMPCVLWGLEAAHARRSLRPLAAAALAFLPLALTLRHETIWQTGVVSALYLVVRPLIEPGPRTVRRMLAPSLVFGLACLLLAGPFLAQAARFLLNTHRSAMGSAFAEWYPLPVWYIPTLVFPEFFGRYHDSASLYWGTWDYVIGWVGVLPVSLLVLRPSMLRDRFAAFWLCLAILALIAILGHVTPLWNVLMAIPGFALLRCPTRLHFLIPLAIAPVVASGIDAAMRGRSRGCRTAPALAAAALVSLALLAAWPVVADAGRSLLERLAARPVPPSSLSQWMKGAGTGFASVRFSLLAALALFAAHAVLLARLASGSRTARALLVALVVAEFGYYGHFYRLPAPPDALSRWDRVAERLGIPAELAARMRDPRHRSAWGIAGAEPVRLARDGFRIDGGHSNFMASREWMAARAALDGDSRGSAWMRLTGVNHVVASETLSLEGFDRVHADSRLGVYERRTPVDPVFVVDRVRSFPDREAAAAAMRGDFDPAREAVVTGVPESENAGAGTAGSAVIVAASFNRVVVRVAALRPALLVLGESWDPDWTARVNGAEVPVWRADVAFRGVRVPAGESIVEFSYEPERLKAAVLLLGLPGGILLFLTLFSRFGRRIGEWTWGG